MINVTSQPWFNAGAVKNQFMKVVEYNLALEFGHGEEKGR
jgi:hypothetical protein